MPCQYTKASTDAYQDFIYAREQLNVAGIEVLSGSAAVGVLTIETDQAIPPDLLDALGLSEQAQ